LGGGKPRNADSFMGKGRSSRKESKPGKSAEALRRIDEVRSSRATSLDLSDLSLTFVPESAFHLKQLDRLNLSFNELTELSPSVGELKQLVELDVRNNKLETLPEAVGKLTHLAELNLSNNLFAKFPEVICKLKKLVRVGLANNKLTVLPDSIGELTQLRFLLLDQNQLTTLPESIAKLTRLTHLWFDNNSLSLLPLWIGSLTQLESLDFGNNQLANLPEALLKLDRLKELFLHGNSGLGLPKEVLGATWREKLESRKRSANPADILEYYFRARGGKRPLNEAKLILVGRGAAGKTTIVNRLVEDTFKPERKTEGIKITEWNLLLNDKENVRLNVWDFGGQEIMHATHQFFFTERSLYLLVLNGREGGEDADAEYWLKLIESFGGDSPAIVVMNKIKEHPFDVNRRALQQKYPFIRDFIRTDCKDRTGIDELDKAIHRETDRLEHLRDAFPASWFTVKDKLAGMKKNFLSFEEYRKECAKLGEKDEKAQEMLAFYLNSLGIALNYRDDPRLKDTHVLNPRWVTNGIYKLLNSPKLEKKRGEIYLSDLSEILERKQYPVRMHRFLFDLMRKFELCFSFPDDDTHYLIPELLDKQEPPETAAFDPDECLSFQYHYAVLPQGLLPRFIVRTHALSENLPRWRTGVIMQFEECKALVKADVQDQKVFISVSGPLGSRRRLLAVIRSDFERIHRDIRNLQPAEMVPVPGYANLVVPYKKLLVLEENRIDEFTEVAGNDVVTLYVDEFLNGVDVDGARRRDRATDDRKEGVRLFYSYSHKDEALRNELETHLKLLQRTGLIDTWHDRKIEAGDDWKQQIDENLDRADIILLLVSSDFIASDYCYEKEMKRALERGEKGEAEVIPIIVRDVNWKKAPFAKLQALPKDGLAVTKWADKDSAWRNVSEGIEQLVTDTEWKRF
jgi:internalin A